MNLIAEIRKESQQESRLAEVDEKILAAVQAYNKSQMLLFTLKAERALLEEEMSCLV